MRLTLKALLMVYAITLLCACSNSFVYNNADWWINWYVDDYLHFNNNQQARFDQYVDQHMRWHRSSQLPRYQLFLQTIRQDIAGEPTVPLVRARFETVYGFWRDFVSTAIPQMTELLSELDDKQTQQFIRRIEQDSADFEREYVTPDTDKVLQKNVRSTEKTAKNWIGPLTDAQKKIIRAWAQATHNVYSASLQQRKFWQQSLGQAMQERNNQAQLRTRLHALFVTPTQYWNKDYKAMVDANETLTAQLLVDLHRSLTINQRKHLFAVIDDYNASLQRLQKTGK